MLQGNGLLKLIDEVFDTDEMVSFRSGEDSNGDMTYVISLWDSDDSIFSIQIVQGWVQGGWALWDVEQLIYMRESWRKNRGRTRNPKDISAEYFFWQPLDFYHPCPFCISQTIVFTRSQAYDWPANEGDVVRCGRCSLYGEWIYKVDDDDANGYIRWNGAFSQ